MLFDHFEWSEYQKKIETFAFLSCRGWVTASAVSGATDLPTNSNIGVSGGPWPCYRGLLPLRENSWMLKYPYGHQIITQTHRTGDRRASEKIEF